MARKLTLMSFSALLATVLFSIFLGELRSERLRQGYSHLTWSDSPRLPIAVGNHRLFLWENYVYVVGGSPNGGNPPGYDPTNLVFRSSIQPDGRLGNWTTITSIDLPELMASGGDVSHSGWMYITGGFNGSDHITATYFGKEIQPNVIHWEQSNYGFAKRSLHTTVIVKKEPRDEIYVIGGLGYSRPNENSVVYSTLNPNTGELDSPWISTTALLPQRYSHAAVAYKGWIYVIGGTVIDDREQHIATKSVKYAKASNGIQGMWNDGPELPDDIEALSEAEAVVTNDGRIFVIGGCLGRCDDSPLSRKVYSATIDTHTGKLSEWQEVRELELPIESGIHSHASVFAPNGSIYVVGGQDNNIGYNNHYIDVSYHIPVLAVTKFNDPPGPVHEGDVITYTISYANTSLITQIITITDILPFNLTLVSNSTVPAADQEEPRKVVWNLGAKSPGASGQVSFRAHVALLPSLQPEGISAACPPPTPPPPSRVLPAAISCDTTRFWAHGVTRQPSVTPPYTIEVQIPPNTNPSEMWLLMKGTDNAAPRVEGQPAQVLTSTHNAFGAAVWTTTITSAMIEAGEVTVVTDNPRELNALFLFDAKDPPFDERDLRVFAEAPTTFTYTLEIPSVKASTMGVLLPFMDITYWTDSSPPEFDGRMITVTVELEGEPTQTILANEPNMGNGLLMTQFPINLRPFTDTITKTKVLTISVDSEDDAVYTLGPRVCRPVYVENTAWLCSDQAGCISATTRNIPENFAPLSIYLPVIMKSYP